MLRTSTGHKNIKSLDTYIRVKPEVANRKADECLSLETPQPPEEPKPVTPKPKPEIDNGDKTEKYIALLQLGLIGKEEFAVLMGLTKEKTHSPIYQ